MCVVTAITTICNVSGKGTAKLQWPIWTYPVSRTFITLHCVYSNFCRLHDEHKPIRCIFEKVYTFSCNTCVTIEKLWTKFQISFSILRIIMHQCVDKWNGKYSPMPLRHEEGWPTYATAMTSASFAHCRRLLHSQRSLTVSLHSPNGRQNCLPVVLCNETVE